MDVVVGVLEMEGIYIGATRFWNNEEGKLMMKKINLNPKKWRELNWVAVDRLVRVMWVFVNEEEKVGED